MTTSGITSKAANGDRFKTGQRRSQERQADSLLVTGSS